MPLDVVPEGVPLLLAGAAMGAVALVLLAIDFASRVNRAFALLLAIRGAVNVLTALRISGRLSPEAHALAFNALPYFAVAVVPATVWFYLAYRGGLRPAARRGGVAVALLGAALVLDAAYALDHALFRTSPGISGANAWSYGPLYLVVGASRVGYGLVALALARAYAKAPALERRRGLLLASLGFGLDPVFLAVNHVVTYEVAGLWPPGDGPWFRANHAVEIAAMLPVLLGAALVARAASRGLDPAAGRDARRYLAALALPAVSALALLVLSPPLAPADAATLAGRQAAYDALDGLWTLSLPLLVGYGLLRRQLFDAEVRLKWTVSRGTVAAFFVVVFIVVSSLAESLLEPRLGPVVGLLAVALLLFAILPLQAAAERVANALLPGVDPSSEAYLTERKLDVYRAALETAFAADGTLRPEEERLLASLRAKLGITDRDHGVLVYAIRAESRALPEPPAEAAGDTLLGRYRLERLLGEGGHGRTFLAEDRLLKREVVVKVMRPERADAPAALREATAIAAIRHPNVVTLYDVERAGDRVVLVMEHVDGGSLADRIASGPVRGEEFAGLVSGLLSALDAVHAARAIHRDVKPSNVLITRGGVPKLADFGIARIPGFETTVDDFGHDKRAGGTARFMSPEQARGRRVTPASDLFSAAATLYEAWSGAPYLAPSPGESAVEVRMRAAAAKPFDLASVAPPALSAWFAKGLEPSVERRYASAREMRDAFVAAYSVT